jgi:hypothetical protein
MPKVEDVPADMRKNPADLRFADACTVATQYFGEPRQTGPSHKVWKMPWAGDPRVNLQKGKGGKAKAVQVRQLLDAIDRLRVDRSEPKDR